MAEWGKAGAGTTGRSSARTFRRILLHCQIRPSAKLLFASGADVKQVQHFLGHSRASVTLDVYTHLLTGEDGEPATRLERLLD